VPTTNLSRSPSCNLRRSARIIGWLLAWTLDSSYRSTTSARYVGEFNRGHNPEKLREEPCKVRQKLPNPPSKLADSKMPQTTTCKRKNSYTNSEHATGRVATEVHRGEFIGNGGLQEKIQPNPEPVKRDGRLFDSARLGARQGSDMACVRDEKIWLQTGASTIPTVNSQQSMYPITLYCSQHPKMGFTSMKLWNESWFIGT
jgi:hypothetical protein